MFKRIYFFFLTYLAVMTYSQTLLLLWFLKNGVSYLLMMIYFLVLFLSTLLFFVVLSRVTFSTRSALFLGVLSSAMGVLIADRMHSIYDIFFIAIFLGLNITLFWTVYNAIHFKYTGHKERGFKSGIYFLFFPIFSALLSPLAGLVAEKEGYHFLFMSGLICYIIPLLFIAYLPSFKFRFELRKSIQRIRYPVLVVFQGYTDVLSYNVIPMLTLFFIASPFKLGSFFGYLAILTAFAALINSKISDRINKRGIFFYLFNSMNSLSYIPLLLSRSLLRWGLFSGVSNLTFGLSNPFNMALVVDNSSEQDFIQTMTGRELFLNLGRVLMVLVALLGYWATHSLMKAVLISVLISLIYPIYAYFQKVYFKNA